MEIKSITLGKPTGPIIVFKQSENSKMPPTVPQPTIIIFKNNDLFKKNKLDVQA